MALFPVISNFVGDFVLQLVPVDTDDTMDEVAAKCAEHSVGRRVAPQDSPLRVRRQGDAEPFARDLVLGEAGIAPMECLEVFFESEAPAPTNPTG